MMKALADLVYGEFVLCFKYGTLSLCPHVLEGEMDKYGIK